jgi:hypothetical protein
MKELDFRPAKSKADFRSNYKLHDLAEKVGKNLLIQWGIEFYEFGEDKRYEKLWEKGEDKPDVILKYKGTSALLDWKGKHSKSFIVNTRAVNSYLRWQEKMNMPVIIAFFVFDELNYLLDRRLALLNQHEFVESEKKQWDKNQTVRFKDDIPRFVKENLVKLFIEKRNPDT